MSIIKNKIKVVKTSAQDFLLRWNKVLQHNPGNVRDLELQVELKLHVVDDPEIKKPVSLGIERIKAEKNIEYLDLSRGFEPIPILVKVDPSSPTTLPASFTYIKTSRPYEDAHISRSMCRIADKVCCPNCKGNYLEASSVCSCIEATGGDFSYNKMGCLNPHYIDRFRKQQSRLIKPKMLYCDSNQDCPYKRKREVGLRSCTGHVTREFLKECSLKCGCTRNCGNRVVHRGITCKLEVCFILLPIILFRD
jgi:hypothetical protein